jgi:GlpG protein
MRLIGTFDTEKEAYAFYSFLLKENIQNIYEPFQEEKSGAKHYRIWVYDEDDLGKAVEWMKSFRENPNDPRFQGVATLTASTPPSPGYSEITRSEDLKWQTVPPSQGNQRGYSFPLTSLIILICGILFLWNGFEEGEIEEKKGPIAEQLAMTPLQQGLFFDDPGSYRYIQEMIDTVPLSSVKEMKDLPQEATALLKKAEETPSWKGIVPFITTGKRQGWKVAEEVPLFEKIRQGEIWRFFTPCVMHTDFLHILFNMIWVWVLVRQIEERIPRVKLCLLILLIGIISNTAQYFASGPYFLGFSGVIVGLAAFIWVRQKRAPWEGYPLQKSTALFLLFFVLAMFAIELVTFGLQLFSPLKVTPNIANTAHIVGGVTGWLLGRFSFFGRKMA